ncbi:MAG: DUF5104 domain-containing protein [Lachnospiraceae bacterium]|nr:DUF5104 domain-containing protein [Lachnospiraceae bacterium]
MFTILSTGCSAVAEVMQDREDRATSKEKSMEICETVLNAMEEGDTLTVKELFCDRVQATHDLDAELQALFSFLGGKIISYGEINAELNHGKLHFIYDSSSNLMNVNIIKDVKLDSEKTYNIFIRHYLNLHDESNADLIGIHDIRVIPTQEYKEDSKTEDIGRVGEFFETIVPQEMPNEYMQIDERSLSYKYRKITSGNILKALQERNASILYELFAKEVQNEQLYSEIENAVTFIDGEMISYSCIDGGSASKSSRDGYYTKYAERVTIYDIMTDTGAMYEISYYAYHICKDSPEKQGVHTITIKHVKPQIIDDVHEIISQIVLENK